MFEGPVTIRGGVSVGEGATFVFGSEDTPEVTATISGGVRSSNAMSVQVHFSTINGGVDLEGGAVRSAARSTSRGTRSRTTGSTAP